MNRKSYQFHSDSDEQEEHAKNRLPEPEPPLPPTPKANPAEALAKKEEVQRKQQESKERERATLKAFVAFQKYKRSIELAFNNSSQARTLLNTTTKKLQKEIKQYRLDWGTPSCIALIKKYFPDTSLLVTCDETMPVEDFIEKMPALDILAEIQLIAEQSEAFKILLAKYHKFRKAVLMQKEQRSEAYPEFQKIEAALPYYQENFDSTGFIDLVKNSFPEFRVE